MCVCKHAPKYFFLNTVCDKIASRRRHFQCATVYNFIHAVLAPTNTACANRHIGRQNENPNTRSSGAGASSVARRPPPRRPAGRAPRVSRRPRQGGKAPAGGSRAPAAPPSGPAPRRSPPLTARRRGPISGSSHEGLGAADKL